MAYKLVSSSVVLLEGNTDPSISFRRNVTALIGKKEELLMNLQYIFAHLNLLSVEAPRSPFIFGTNCEDLGVLTIACFRMW